jgi:hypothetical protein
MTTANINNQPEKLAEEDGHPCPEWPEVMRRERLTKRMLFELEEGQYLTSNMFHGDYEPVFHEEITAASERAAQWHRAKLAGVTGVTVNVFASRADYEAWDRRVHRRGPERAAATPEFAAEPRYLREVADVFIADSMDLPLDMVEPILDARETYGVLAGLVPEECCAEDLSPARLELLRTQFMHLMPRGAVDLSQVAEFSRQWTGLSPAMIAGVFVAEHAYRLHAGLPIQHSLASMVGWGLNWVASAEQKEPIWA